MEFAVNGSEWKIVLAVGGLGPANVGVLTGAIDAGSNSNLALSWIKKPGTI